MILRLDIDSDDLAIVLRNGVVPDYVLLQWRMARDAMIRDEQNMVDESPRERELCGQVEFRTTVERELRRTA